MSQIKEDKLNTITEISKRIMDIRIELISMSYSQSNPGQMMDRRMLRKEIDKLERQLDTLIHKKNE
jgi:hypothetical protein